jgi:NAD(P)-dependent dehydrogenase (short-subunit alcohol dehydrogenase family)
MRFDDKITLVTGASRGIGRAIAHEFAQSGARIAIHYNNQQREAEKTRDQLPGGPHEIFQANVAQADETRLLVESVVERMGGVDILVNNAGVFESHILLEVDFDQWQSAWQKTLGVNLLGPANLIYWVSQHMMDHGGGRIVNVSSRGAFRGEPEAPAYGASKAGLNAMSQSLAKALAPHNIFICVVAPGWVQTDMARETLMGEKGERILADIPIGRAAHPEEVARTVRFLASEGTDALTGCIVDVNGASYLRT